MKKNIKYIIIFLFLLLVLILMLFILKLNATEKHKINENEEEIVTLIDDINITDKNEAIVVYLENKVKEQEITENAEETKDAYILTQEIYNINGAIGHLNIPKIELNTEVFSNQTVEKMEEMPCFLYTTGGLNKVGTTLIVGHNRANGTLFSNNSKLEEGDEFYFTDLEGNKLKYIVKSKTIKLDTDTSFLTEEVDKPTMVLSCCTDNNDEYRIIIIGEAKLQ